MTDALFRVSMGNVVHIEKERKELVKDVHRSASLGVRLSNLHLGNILVQNGKES